MTTPINVKVTLANVTEQLNIAEPGKPLRVKAAGKGQFQLFDPKTGKTPEAFTAKRVGKDLLITVSTEEGATADVVIEGFTEAEGSSLLGEAVDGTLFEYVPTTDLGQAPGWTDGQAFFFATEQTLATSSALVAAPLFATPLASLGVLGAGAAGAGLANAQGAGPAAGNTGNGTGGNAGQNANPEADVQARQAAVTRISTAAQLNNAGPATTSLADYTAAGVTGVNDVNLLAMSSVLNSLAIDGAAVNSTAKIQAMVDAMNAVIGGAGAGLAC